MPCSKHQRTHLVGAQDLVVGVVVLGAPFATRALDATVLAAPVTAGRVWHRHDRGFRRYAPGAR